MSEPYNNMTRLHQLLADRATQRLSDAEGNELMGLLGSDALDDSSFDWTAAALDLPNVLEKDAVMPARLRNRIEADAVEWMRSSKGV
jgi:hypothetical protein